MYDVNYFIKKFEAIPENQWLEYLFSGTGGGHCAQGHCGVDWDSDGKIIGASQEVRALNGLMSLVGSPSDKEWQKKKFMSQFVKKIGYPWAADINNGRHPGYQQSNPKQRILAALYDIREKTIKAQKTAKMECIK